MGKSFNRGLINQSNDVLRQGDLLIRSNLNTVGLVESNGDVRRLETRAKIGIAKGPHKHVSRKAFMFRKRLEVLLGDECLIVVYELAHTYIL